MEKHSPVANNSNRETFLYGLSFDTPFKNLLDSVLALPTPVSSFFIVYADLSNCFYIIYKITEYS